MARGKLLVISGPSGVGKSTAIAGVLSRHPDMYFSVSATTRPMREGDREGVTYLFRTRREFEELIRQDFFYEYAEYSGNYYGTPKTPVEERLDRGQDVILDIEAQGAFQIRRQCRDAVLVFLAAPMDVIEQRLRGRGDTSEADIQKRLKQARWECAQAGEYDYLVLSDTPERTVNDIDCILSAEKLRTAGRLNLLELEENK